MGQTSYCPMQGHGRAVSGPEVVSVVAVKACCRRYPRGQGGAKRAPPRSRLPGYWLLAVTPGLGILGGERGVGVRLDKWTLRGGQAAADSARLLALAIPGRAAGGAEPPRGRPGPTSPLPPFGTAKGRRAKHESVPRRRASLSSRFRFPVTWQRAARMRGAKAEGRRPCAPAAAERVVQASRGTCGRVLAHVVGQQGIRAATRLRGARCAARRRFFPLRAGRRVNALNIRRGRAAVLAEMAADTVTGPGHATRHRDVGTLARADTSRAVTSPSRKTQYGRQPCAPHTRAHPPSRPAARRHAESHAGSAAPRERAGPAKT